MEVQLRPIGELKPYKNNPRKNLNVDKVANSIKQFGFQQPIVVDKDNNILVGHTRFEASKKLDLKKIPVVVADLDETKAKAYRIADNKVAQDSEWDLPKLNLEIESLKDDEFEIDLLGFNTGELDSLFKEYDPEIKTYMELKTKPMSVSDLKPHPKHYKSHPQDQIDHISKSIKQHGFYRNVIVSKDGTILDGHALVKAAEISGIKEVPTITLDIDPNGPQAVKLMASQNEIQKLSEVDDRKLSEILKEVSDKDNLDGTGYDKMMLANLAMVTRSANEIKDINEAAEWVGMPDYEPKDDFIKYTIQFRSAEDRQKFAQLTGMELFSNERKTWSAWWPKKEKEDLSSVKYE